MANKNVSDGFFRSYYSGSETKENFVISAMRILAPYSILRRKNEIEVKGILFCWIFRYVYYVFIFILRTQSRICRI